MQVVPLYSKQDYEERLPASTTLQYLYCTYCTTLPVLSIPTLTTVQYLPAIYHLLYHLQGTVRNTCHL